MSRRKALAILLVVLALTSFLWIPAMVYAAQGQATKFDYYVKALDYGLKGLIQYFQFIINLFKTAVGAG